MKNSLMWVYIPYCSWPLRNLHLQFDQEYPQLSEEAIKILYSFPTTYICKARLLGYNIRTTRALDSAGREAVHMCEHWEQGNSLYLLFSFAVISNCSKTWSLFSKIDYEICFKICLDKIFLVKYLRNFWTSSK